MAAGPGADRALSARWIGAALLVAGLVVFLLVASRLVPWHPVPGGTPPPVDPLTVFTPAQVDRGEAYSGLARIAGWASLAISLAVVAWLGFSSRGARIVGRIALPWPCTVVVAAGLVLGLVALATLPVTLVAWHRRTVVGLTTQPLTGLLRDWAVSWAVDVAFSSVALVLLVAAARLLPRWWPALAGLAGAALVVTSTYLYPVVVEPAFNEFTPLSDGPLERRIDQLATIEGVQLDGVLVADASRRTTALNAYVSGFGDHRRVVVYDTLLELPDREVLSVVAHELAHARHRDVETGTALGAAATLVGVGALAMLLGAPSVRRRAGVRGLADPRCVPLLLALSAFATVATAPVENAISRRIEARADVDALKATGDPVAFVEMQRDLALAALADPTPPRWSQWWFGSHPTVLERIALAVSPSNPAR